MYQIKRQAESTVSSHKVPAKSVSKNQNTRRKDSDAWESISHYFALIMLGLFPLFIGRKGYINITECKYYCFVTVTTLFLAACLLIGIGYLITPKLRQYRFRSGMQRLTLSQIFMLAYMAWATLSAILSPYDQLWKGQSRYEGLCALLLYGFIFLALSFWGEYSPRYYYVLTGMALVLFVIALPQSFGSSLIYPADYNYSNTHFLTTTGNVDCVAGFVSMLVPALLCIFSLNQIRWSQICLPAIFLVSYIQFFADVDTGKIGLLVAIAVSLPFLLSERNRMGRTLCGLSPIALAYGLHALLPGASVGDFTAAPGRKCLLALLLALLLAASGYLLCRSGKPLPLSERTMRRLIAVVLAVLLIAALIFIFTYHGSNSLLGEASALLHGRLSDELGTYRGYIWKCCLQIIRNDPIIGNGPGSFASAFDPYNTGYQVYCPNTVVDFAHNDLLQIAVSTGLVGLALYVAFLITMAIRAVKSLLKNIVVLPLFAGVVGYLVYSFFVFSIAIVTPVFWVMAGLIDKAVRQISAEEL